MKSRAATTASGFSSATSEEMKKTDGSRRAAKRVMRPGREHWWWRENHLKHALKENPSLDQFFHWKVIGRASLNGAKWTHAQRRQIETGLWLYELDARISQKYLFEKPAHLLAPERLSSVVAFAGPISDVSPIAKPGGQRKPFSWAWIEACDKRNANKSTTLTRAELNGIIAAMKYCLEYFLRR